MTTYRPTTLQKILHHFTQGERLGVTQLAQLTGLSRAILHRYIKALLDQGDLEKVGEGPQAKYCLKNTSKILQTKDKSERSALPYQATQLLNDTFLKYTPQGTVLQGHSGLIRWCEARWLDPVQKAESYLRIAKHINSLRNSCGVLDATNGFKKNMNNSSLDNIYYADQYKRMDFGRGKLAEMTFYAKQSQNRKGLLASIALFLDQLRCLIQHEKVDALAFVPATITRQWQLLHMLDEALQDVNLPRITIKKFYEGSMKIPQKSLKKREERIANAQHTIYIRDAQAGTYQKVLLIDDFVGSGATLNETAKKLKKEGVKKVIGFAIVGNMDMSYDIINEM